MSEIPDFLLEMSEQMNSQPNRCTSHPLWQVRCKRYLITAEETEETEEIVTTHLTEADANWFIQRKQHDYPKLYTYVESAYWSPQLRELEDWIKQLTNKGGDV